MTILLSLISLGFILGMRHATDADHVVAVGTIVSRERSVRKAGLIGAAWGVGHSLTVLLVGSAIILFGLTVPKRLGLSLELTVAFMLVGLGLWNIRAFLAPSPALAPAARAHPHPHLHPHPPADDSLPANSPAQRVWRPLLIGIVHGLAGSAAVALMVVPLIRNPWWAAAYLGVFGFGTVAGMMLITIAMSVPFRASAGSRSLHRRLGQFAATVSLGFGLFLIYDIGFVQGLFLR